jgi:hypothetical protein
MYECIIKIFVRTIRGKIKFQTFLHEKENSINSIRMYK